MKKKDKVLICDVLQQYREEIAESLLPESEGTEEQSPEDVSEEASRKELSIDFKGVLADAIDVEVINDEYGRISDVFEAFEEDTGMSVIPFKMGKIAPEVVSLARHKIYEFDGEHFAMSYKVRDKAVDQMVERVVRSLSSGMPFKEDLVTTINYKGKNYRTLTLSEDEWLLVLSKFRHYKENLYITNDNQLMLEISTERK